MTQKKIAIIGECMIELSEKGENIKRGFGGDTLNTAVYLARQSDKQLRVDYVTALGTDSFSDQMIAAWQQENVETALVQRLDNKMPGLYFIETDDHGERTFWYWRNDAAARFWLDSAQADAICQQLAHYDYLYLSGISLAILPATSREKLMTLLSACRQNGGKVIFDNNYRPRLWADKASAQQAYAEMLRHTDMAFLTLDDEDLLWGEQPLDAVIARTRAAGVQEIAIKRGADSCLVAVGDEPLREVAAIKLAKEKVIDTTAAGDSFSAGYLAVRLAGGSAEDAAARGHLTASTVIQYRGAIIPLSAMPK
ncbi:MULTISPECIES: sugar kinase [Pantoea]|jgi:2-dehydro-3-deoxygluconokinase|uniref:2-dehydro-3-deoxygluconokinase n=3 Tax=Pantoea TaxID=53335 RepID=A0AAU7TWF6_9GAMM|nr:MULTISPECIES: sugar kinase [Pantoea]MBD9645860.1 sugar kinase [Pantoea sp. PNT02]PLR20750.1 ketodeoxygluconokinase [Pantoea endophytica]WFL67655.1 sugar kinase [Pantoea sp. X85]